MLVNIRKVGQSMMIGDNIKVTVTHRLSNGTVKLGVEAPKDIKVMKKEVHDAEQLDKNIDQQPL